MDTFNNKQKNKDNIYNLQKKCVIIVFKYNQFFFLDWTAVYDELFRGCSAQRLRMANQWSYGGLFSLMGGVRADEMTKSVPD